MGGSEITASDWSKGIFLSILASIIGGISKLAIRKSWLLQADRNHRHNHGGGYGQGMVTADTNLLSNERECYDYTNTNIENDPSSRNNDAEVDDEGDGNEEQVIPNTGRNNPTLLPYSLRYSGMFGMSVLNPICCVLAMNYASPSILAPFSGLTLVWVILGSPLVNNEKPSNQQILACSFIIAGEVVVAIFGDHTNDENVTVNSVLISYAEPAFVSYFVGLIAFLALMVYWINCSESSIRRRFAWGCTGGAITGAQNFLKDTLTVAKSMEQQQKWPLLVYVFGFFAASTAFVGLLILTACMKRYDATYSAASFVGSFVVSASIMAAVHYNTFEELDGVINSVLYPSGLLLLMGGVYMLVKESCESGGDEDDNSMGQHRQLDATDAETDCDTEDAFRFFEVDGEATREETVV